MITDNEPRTKLELGRSPFHAALFRSVMEIWLFIGGRIARPRGKIRNTRSEPRIALESGGHRDKLNGIYGPGEIAYTAFENAILRPGPESRGNVQGFNHSFLAAGCPRVCQRAREGTREEKR